MLRYIGFRTYLNVFRRALLGDPPERVEPMAVRLQPGARAMRVKPRASPPAKAAWLHEHMANWETAGMVFRNPQAFYGSAAMVIPKGSNSHVTFTEYRAVNDTIDDRTGGYAHAKSGRQSVSVRGHHRMVHAGYAARLLAGAAERGRPRDVHHGHAGGVVHPAPCSAGGAERYRIFPGDDGDGYIDKICLVWVDDIVIWGETLSV